MTLTVCHTPDVAYEASERLKAALKASKDADAAAEAALADLRKAVVEEVAKRNRPVDVGRAVGWHPGHVRRLARDANVPGYVDRKPPSAHRSDSEADHDGSPPS